LRRGSEREVALEGYNLGAVKTHIAGQASQGREDTVVLRPETPRGAAFNEVELALGDDPEIEATGANTGVAAAQTITLPVTVNGRIEAPPKTGPIAHYYRFRAGKGQRVILEVKARRLGSQLDSLVEVLDAQGKPLERATVRATWETFLVLRDHGSADRGMRIQSWNGLNVGDYLMVGHEIVRVEEVPDGPDEDTLMEAFGGQRRSFFGTTNEAHGIDRPVYKVQIHPPAAQFSPNGLPLVRLHYRNDDGGPGYGKDSLLDFTAPAEGDYLVRIRDVRGEGGAHHAYRLNLREPRPDFRLSVTPRNPNVPRGGTIPLTVTARRLDGYDGPIELSLVNLPPGLSATTNTIAAGQDAATLLLTAAADIRLEQAAPLEVRGSARVGTREVVHSANPDDHTKLIALAPKPDILMSAETKIVELAPGQTAEVKVRLTRQNGFAGRVPVQVRDLPARVRVTDSGLNGVLLNEDEQERTFTLWALPNAEPVEGIAYVAGLVETRSPQQNLFAATQPIVIRVKPKNQVTANSAR
jgi:hypothetical protein